MARAFCEYTVQAVCARNKWTMRIATHVQQILAQACSRKQILAQAEDRASLAQANLAQAPRKQILVAGLIS